MFKLREELELTINNRERLPSHHSEVSNETLF
jgi:hypothetical protein